MMMALAMRVRAQSFLTNGLVAYYPFNGNANDASGNGNNGIVYGATLATDRFGNSNSAYYFNGTNNYITAAITNLPSGAAARTLTAWVNRARSVPEDESMLSAIGYGANNADSQFGIGFGYGDGVTVWAGYNDFDPPNPPIAVPLSNWCFIAVTYSNLSVSFTVNGITYNSNYAEALNTYNNGKLFVGVMSVDGNQPSVPAGSWDEWFTGSIDDIRIYNRALAGSEVQQLYLYESVPVPCLPHRATATATVTNGFVVGATVTDVGCGYTNTPLVLILGGGGTGATATAVVTNGFVASITITSGGNGYTNTPTIYIYSPFGLQIGLLKAVTPTFSDLLIGSNYQLQVSSDLNDWTNQGSVFTATNPTGIYPQYWNVDNWGQLFFRLQVVP